MDSIIRNCFSAYFMPFTKNSILANAKMLFFLRATPLRRSRRWRKRCSPRAKLVEMAVRRHRLCCSLKTASGFYKSAPPLLLSPKSFLRNTFWGPRFGFNYLAIFLPKNKTARKSAVLFFGGDGGNRNRVRKFAHITFYMLSLCFGIPFPCRSQTSCRDW